MSLPCCGLCVYLLHAVDSSPLLSFPPLNPQISPRLSFFGQNNYNTFCNTNFYICQIQKTFFIDIEYACYIVYVIKVLHTNTFWLYEYVIYGKCFNYKMTIPVNMVYV